jgi:hypothetical protein
MIERQKKRKREEKDVQSRPNPWRAKLFSSFFVLLLPLIPTAVSFVLFISRFYRAMV